MNDMARVLKELREDKGLSQTELAKIMNITQRAYSFYETGRSEPKRDILIKLADFYGLSLDIIMARYKVNNNDRIA